MKTMKGKRAILLISFTAVSLLFSACGQKAQEPKVQQQAQPEQEADKVPDQLKALEGNIEQIVKILGGPAMLDEKAPEAQQKKDDKQKQGEGQQGQKPEGGNKEDAPKDNAGKEQSGSKQAGASAQEAQSQQPQGPWEELSPAINTLHYQWNAYMPMSMKKGANRQLVDNFSNTLNSLTNTIISKNRTNALLVASSLYSFIPDFYSLYRTETSPDIKRIRHSIRNSMFNSSIANWPQVEADLNNLKSTWSLYKNTVPKEQQENAGKLDFSIYELERVIRDKNQPLIDIKGRVALSNVQALEKASEKGK